MKNSLFTAILAASMALFSQCKTAPVEPNSDLRAPAYPLVTIDPYTCVWSFSDNLAESTTKHWTGRNMPFLGVLRVDGKNYRFMGKEEKQYVNVVEMAIASPWEGAYTYNEPKGKWQMLDFNDSKWEKGKAPWATPEISKKGTIWETQDVWVRREIELSEDDIAQPLLLKYSHDDIFELYINGVQVVKTDYVWKNNVIVSLGENVKNSLKAGKNVIAAHCHNTTGGGYVDFGLIKEADVPLYFTETAKQTLAKVLPTNTIYKFEAGNVELKLSFTTPLLCSDLNLLTRPVSYVSYEVSALDNAKHDVQIYFEATPEWAVNEKGQEITSEMYEKDGLRFAKTGTKEQDILGRKGDDVRIDWGYFYLAGNPSNSNMMISDMDKAKEVFSSNGALDNTVVEGLPSNMNKGMTTLAYSQDISATGKGFMMIGYDDIYSIQYFGDNLKSVWTEKYPSIESAFAAAEKDYTNTMLSCANLDAELMAEAKEVGGKEYSELCALAYRQTIAAHKLVRNKNGELMLFSKENFSNGSIGTVDVTYPSVPFFLYYNTELTKALINFIIEYSESGRWEKPFAAHDVGTYPKANGQTYGGDMPIEESGNMLIIATAICQNEKSAAYAEKHWDVFTTWANYLIEKGLDPENQLCTDDFAGHFAHNANLSIKAILGIAGYGKMADMLGKKDVAEKYTAAAKDMAKKWEEMDIDGDHYKLTFDRADTWSQKYNLVWDKLLKLNIFNPEIAKKEIAYYLTKQNKYGLPLDSRREYTKSDWIIWTATLADSPEDFNTIVAPVYKYANETKTRMPLSDWHDTETGNSVGFRARSVVGGYYIKMLEKKYK